MVSITYTKQKNEKNIFNNEKLFPQKKKKIWKKYNKLAKSLREKKIIDTTTFTAARKFK